MILSLHFCLGLILCHTEVICSSLLSLPMWARTLSTWHLVNAQKNVLELILFYLYWSRLEPLLFDGDRASTIEGVSCWGGAHEQVCTWKLHGVTYLQIHKVEKSVLNHYSAKRARSEWPPVQVKRCRLYWSSAWETFVSVRYAPSYICMCLLTPSNDSVNHYSPVCSRSLWRRRPLHSLPASCANSPALH